MDAISKLDQIIPTGETAQFNVAEWRQKCYAAMNDDFNSPILIAHLFEAVKYINAVADGKANMRKADLEIIRQTMHAFVFDVLGLTQVTESQSSDKLDAAMQVLIELRMRARNDKNWALSDKIRDDLAAAGIVLKDGKDGTSYTISE